MLRAQRYSQGHRRLPLGDLIRVAGERHRPRRLVGDGDRRQVIAGLGRDPALDVSGRNGDGEGLSVIADIVAGNGDAQGCRIHALMDGDCGRHGAHVRFLGSIGVAGEIRGHGEGQPALGRNLAQGDDHLGVPTLDAGAGGEGVGLGPSNNEAFCLRVRAEAGAAFRQDLHLVVIAVGKAMGFEVRDGMGQHVANLHVRGDEGAFPASGYRPRMVRPDIAHQVAGDRRAAIN